MLTDKSRSVLSFKLPDYISSILKAL